MARSTPFNSANWFLSNQSSASVTVVRVHQHSSTMRFNTKRSCQVVRDVRTVPLQIRHRVDFPWARSSNRQDPVRQCSKCDLLRIVSLSFLFFSLLLPSWSSVVTSAKLYRCQRFHSVLHLSQPTHPLRPVDSVLSVLHIPAPAHLILNVSPMILSWSVGSSVSRIPISQMCNAVVVPKQKRAWLRRMHNFSL